MRRFFGFLELPDGPHENVQLRGDTNTEREVPTLQLPPASSREGQTLAEVDVTDVS